MAAVLAVVAMVMCTLNMLKPEHLTAVTTAVANKMLDADVSIGSVELRLTGKMPLLKLRVDSITVISGPMTRVVGEDRQGLPQWADTLVTLRRFEGGINIGALLRNRIDLYDVEFERPAINLLSVNDSLNNYVIYQAAADTVSTESGPLPKISINRFRILDPKPLRFSNLATGEHFTVALQSLTLDGGEAPAYSINVGGNVASPMLSVYNLDKLRFGVDGRVAWEPEKPTELELRNFRLQAEFLDALLSTHVDFGHDMIVHDFSLDLGEMGVERILSVVPDSLRKAYGIGPEKFKTDVAISFKARSTGPFNLTTDSIPSADLELVITPGNLRYQQAAFKRVGGTVLASLKGNDLNAASFTVRDFVVAGPATNLTINATATQIMTDPLVQGSVTGATELQKLPEALRALARGYIAGKVTADLKFKGRPSMLTRNNFHRLHFDGQLDADRVYYLSSDTANMVYVDHANLAFGSHGSNPADSLLTAIVSVDSADILHTQYSMKVKDFRLGVGVSNQRRTDDTTVVVPMGGDMKLGKFYLTVLGDSIAFNMREAHGRVTMNRYNDEAKRPLFGLDLEVRNISTGTPTARFMLSRAEVHANAHKLDRPPLPKAVKNIADSIIHSFPDLPMDSVYKRAIEIQRNKRRSPYPRIHPEFTAEETEIIDWGTSKFLRRLLLEWGIEGSVKAKRAGLFTPFFPIRNRVRNFNVAFNNDSINLTDIKYKAGSSDFLLSGRISNIKRSLTSKGFRSPLKMNFEVVSDTIDVNELANSTFRGSAYAAARDESEGKHDFSLAAVEDAEYESDEEFEKEMGKFVENTPDSMAPLLIPRNIEASVDVKANNILYSDLLFHDFTGHVLASQGALNLHNLAASSDVGSINLSALYSAPSANDLKFGFGMQVNDFNIQRFTHLMPALDSIMPLLNDLSGIIDADVAATCDIDKAMNLELPTLEAAIRLSGDSLVFIDPETYRTIGKWLMFKDKQDNVIKHMNVELTVKDNMMRLYPFIFDLDRYKLGVQGHNDLALNFDYHIAVLKSPLPFKFGVNIKGNPDDYKVRLGKARLNEKQAVQSVAIVDTTRVNLLAQLENVFRRGVSNSRFAKLNISSTPVASEINLNADTISHADSLMFIKEGLIPAPPAPAPDKAPAKKDKRRNRKKNTPGNAEAVRESETAVKPDEN